MFVSHILEKLSLSPRSAHQSPLSVNHQIFTSFGQWRSFLSSCYWISSKLSKWRILVTMTMHHYHCHWSRALYQVLVRMLIKKRPLLTVYNPLTHCRIPMIYSSVVVDKFTASFEVLSGLIKWFKWLMVMRMCGLCVSERHWSQHSVFSTWHK